MSLSEIKSVSAKSNPINKFHVNSLDTESLESDTVVTDILSTGELTLTQTSPSASINIKYVRASFTGAQLMTAYSVPLLLLPAQGSNTVVQPISVSINFVSNPSGTITQIFPIALQYGLPGLGITTTIMTGYVTPYSGLNANGYTLMPIGNTLSWSGFPPLEFFTVASSLINNQAVYISSQTDSAPSPVQTGTFVFDMVYYVIDIL